jgi:hypothetical protein
MSNFPHTFKPSAAESSPPRGAPQWVQELTSGAPSHGSRAARSPAPFRPIWARIAIALIRRIPTDIR